MPVRYSPPVSSSEVEAEVSDVLDVEIISPNGLVLVQRTAEIRFVWTRPVNGFTEDAPRVRSFGPGGEDLQPGGNRIAYLSHFSGNDGDRTYTAQLNLPPSSIGQVEIFIGPEVATLSTDMSVAGPPAPRFIIIEYNTARSVQSPGLTIRTPPTSIFYGSTYTVGFFFTEPVGGFTVEDIILSDPNIVITDFEQVDLDGAGYEATLQFPVATGSVTVTVEEFTVQGEHARGPAEDVEESFVYDNRVGIQDRTLTGAVEIETLTKELATLVDGSLAGVHETFFYSGYFYVLAQVIPSRQSQPNNFPNTNIQAGGELWRLRVNNPQWRLIKSWDYITVAGRSFALHKSSVYFFEGHYLAYQANDRVDTIVQYDENTRRNERVRTYAWKEDVGKVYRISGLSLVEIGQTYRSAFLNPDRDEAFRDKDYGIHGGMMSNMWSQRNANGQQSLNLISGYGDIRNLNNTESEARATDNFQWLEHQELVDNRFSLVEVQKTGWQHLQDIAVAAHAVIGFTPSGQFFMNNRGAKVAKIASDISAADTSVDYHDASVPNLPTSGQAVIGEEVVNYTLSGNTMTLTARGQIDTSAVAHAENTQIIFFDRVLMLNGEDTDIDAISFNADTEWRYNSIEIQYGVNAIAIARDEDSIASRGEDKLELQVTHFAQNQDLEAEWLAQKYLAEFSRFREITNLELSLDKNLQPTQVIYLHIPSRAHFSRAVEVLEVNHNLSRTEQSTTVTLMTV